MNRQGVIRLLNQVQLASKACPCHGHGAAHNHNHPSKDTDYAFEMATSTIRYGKGVTQEIGMDMNNIKAKKVVVFTDSLIKDLLPMKQVIESLEREKVNYVIFDKVKIEPTDVSIKESIDFVNRERPDAFIAVGGGSTIDTAKAANLYLCHPDADFLDFVNGIYIYLM